jgi:hypothetical protein
MGEKRVKVVVEWKLWRGRGKNRYLEVEGKYLNKQVHQRK